MVSEIKHCRICSNRHLVPVIHLGSQALTGVFPKTIEEPVLEGPLELVQCDTREGGCGLVQLRHSYPLDAMYGENYGYRSGLNASMVRHLHHRVATVQQWVQPQAGQIVLDIGSNDSTTLRAYGNLGLKLIGMDPTGVKFHTYYPEWVDLIPDFFSAQAFQDRFGSQKAKIVTSFAMFYDLDDPTDFMRQIASILDDQGVWVFEQSYLPLMVERNAYDTICHEHLSYYGAAQIAWMAERAGLRIIDLEANDINGGSFCVTVAHQNSHFPDASALVQQWIDREQREGYLDLSRMQAYRREVEKHRDLLCETVHAIGRAGKSLYGYGASTKGNVLLQYCGFTSRDVWAIAEVNSEKFGRWTPGTHIPICSEAEVRAARPDYLLVLPWHFREGIVQREANYLQQGGRLLFPLPTIDSVESTPARRAAA